MKKSYVRKNFIRLITISSLFCFILIAIFPIITCGDSNESFDLYLNKVGFCNVEVGYDVHVDGDYAYVTNNDGLMVIDVSDPQNPVKSGELLFEDGANGFVLEDDMAYIAAGSSGLVIADISDPLQPKLIGQYIGGFAHKLAVSASKAYVSYMNSGFKVFDVSIPSDLNPIGEFSDTRSDAIEVKGDIVYFANAGEGLKIFDVSEPNYPELLGTIPQTGGTNDIFINDNKMFIACWGRGIKILDISNPDSPLIPVLDSYIDSDGGEELGLIERDDLLYVADNDGIELFNVTDPTDIVKIAENRDSISAAHDIDLDDEYIYVALGGGLLILEVSTTSEGGIAGFNYYLCPIILLTFFAISLNVYYKVIHKRKK